MKKVGRAWRWPLFLRIFAVMLLTLILVQAFNFALVLLVPPPQPTITSVSEVARALSDADYRPGRLRTSDGAIAGDMPQSPRDTMVGDAIATRLSLPPSDVRVRHIGPGGHGPPGMFSDGGPPPAADNDRTAPQRLLIGDFAISAKIAGHWRTVRPSDAGVAPWRRSAIFWLIGAIFVVAPIAWLLARALARPIGMFASAAERLGRDPKAPPLALEGPPEISDAAIAFNQMQARLNRYVEDRTTLMAAIAHDLRTPLMRLGLRLEHAPDELRNACEDDIRDMEQMIAAVMAFVRDMTRTSRRQRLDLRSLAESVTDGFNDAGGVVRLQGGGPVIFDGDAPALKAMLSNLIGNALKYAGSAFVRFSHVDGNVVIEVQDDGPGMPDDELDRAFDPFFRGERSRNRDTGGIGLGLASARTVARAHGGDVTLRNRSEGGLIAHVSLPL